jgi:hypothetical protein
MQTYLAKLVLAQWGPCPGLDSNHHLLASAAFHFERCRQHHNFKCTASVRQPLRSESHPSLFWRQDRRYFSNHGQTDTGLAGNPGTVEV